MNTDGAFAPRVRGLFCQLWFGFKDGLEPTRAADAKR